MAAVVVVVSAAGAGVLLTFPEELECILTRGESTGGAMVVEASGRITATLAVAAEASTAAEDVSLCCSSCFSAGGEEAPLLGAASAATISSPALGTTFVTVESASISADDFLTSVTASLPLALLGISLSCCCCCCRCSSSFFFSALNGLRMWPMTLMTSVRAS